MLKPVKFRNWLGVVIVSLIGPVLAGNLGARGSGGGGHGGGGHGGGAHGHGASGGHASVAGHAAIASHQSASARSSTATAVASGKSFSTVSVSGAGSVAHCPLPGTVRHCSPHRACFYHGYAPYPTVWWSNGYSDYDYSYSYEDLGRQWGENLRKEQLSWEQLLASIQQEILIAPAGARNDFRRGFLWGYGKGGVSIFNRAMEEARALPPAQPAPPE